MAGDTARNVMRSSFMKRIPLTLLTVISVFSAPTLIALGKLGPVSTVAGDILIETVILSATSADSKPGRKRDAPMTFDATCVFQEIKSLRGVNAVWATNFVSSETELNEQRDRFRYVSKVDSDLDAMLGALADDKRVQIIQKPRIKTPHATPASLFIGSTVPYVHGTTYGRPKSAAYFPGKQFSDREEDLYVGAPHACRPHFFSTGVSLELTPYVNSNGHLEMRIRQTLRGVVGTTNITGVGDVPITQSIESKVSVTVRDGETFIVGGCQSSREVLKALEPSAIKPASHHLPTQNPRRELFVLLRPTILSNSTERPGLGASIRSK